jgi:chemotaxis protein CheX
MTATHPITEQVIQNSITKAVQNLCATMLRHDGVFEKRITADSPEAHALRGQIIGNVGFVGETNGVVYLCLSEDFALFAATTILGMSRAEVEFEGDGVLKDVIGEVTNMTVGGFKNQLCDLGFPCKLTLPTIVRGQHLAVAAIKSATRHLFLFNCSGHRLVADIQIRAE